MYTFSLDLSVTSTLIPLPGNTANGLALTTPLTSERASTTLSPSLTAARPDRSKQRKLEKKGRKYEEEEEEEEMERSNKL